MKDFFQLREAVKSADKKPENYTDPATGKTKTRMVPVDKKVVNTEAKDPREYDYEGDMAKTQLKTMIDAAQELHDMMEDDENLPEWVQSKITKAVDYIDSVRDYMTSESDDEDEDDDDEDEEMNETKAAPKGFHFTKDGKLKRGDADQDGPGGRMLRADPLDKQRSKVPPVSEKTLTPAEKKKREEIAKAMERENPGMDMSKKMAIATATAKKVAEGVELDEVSTEKLRDYASAALQDKDKAKADKRWKYASKAMKTVGDREAKAAHALKYNKMEETQLDEKAPKIKPDFLKTQREKDRAHDAAMGRTATGRKKTMTSTQRSLASMRKEEVELGEAKLSQQQRDRLDDLILNVHMTTHPEYDGGETPDKYLKAIEKEFGAKVAKQVKDGIEIAHWGRDNHSGGNDKLSWRKGGARITKSGKMNKQDVEALKNRIKRDKQWGGITKKVKLPEEVELDEISKRTAYNYTKKAGMDIEDLENKRRQAARAGKPFDQRLSDKESNKLDRRQYFLKRATDRVNEVSDELKQRYINRAMGDHQHANAVRKDAESTGKTDLAAKMRARMKKRNKGMTRAFGGERD